MLTSNKSEANIRLKVTDAIKPDKNATSAEKLKPQRIVSSKNHNTVRPLSKKMSMRPASKRSNFAKNMFNPNAMNKNLHQQSKLMTEKKEKRRLKIESKEYQKISLFDILF